VNFKGPPPEPSQHGDAADIAAGPCFGARHVAIIMDGNGRWAKSKNLPRAMGHKKGVEAVRKLVREAGEIGLETLTLYAFSSENWNRPEDEVKELMRLLRQYLRSETAEFHSKNLRLSVMGCRDAFDQDIVQLIENAEDLTHNNTGLHVNIALNYGGRHDIAQAARKIALRAIEEGEVGTAQDIERCFSEHLMSADMPDPDLLIRTSGETRISNFLLWQCAYAEMIFTPVLWPDFKEADFLRALDDYAGRDRRFGAVQHLEG